MGIAARPWADINTKLKVQGLSWLFLGQEKAGGKAQQSYFLWSQHCIICSLQQIWLHTNCENRELTAGHIRRIPSTTETSANIQ